MQTEVSVEMLEQIVGSVFSTMMSLEVSPTTATWSLSGDRLTSSVYLTGDWNGAVLLDCNPRQACQFAGRILSMDPPEVVDDDVRDVLGELANMIGGNMKCSMTTGVSLSMPTVMEGRDYDMRICGSQVLERVAFQCDEGHFWVTVLSTKG
ncbi:MAG: chemotaxis protein CheX [Terracidiphilus sp.]